MATDKVDVSDALDGMLDLSEASRQAAKKVRDQIKVMRSFGDAVSTLGSTILSTDDSFVKYSNSVDKNIRFLNNFVSMGLGPRGVLAFTTITSAVGYLTKMVLEFDDTRLKNFDSLSKFGISTSITAEKLTDIINQSGYWSARSEGFMQAVENIGTGLINLGRTTAEGTEKLSEIISLDSVDEFMKLGLSPERLTNLQADYIKMQETAGFGLNKQSAEIKRSSYDYVKELNKLSALTGVQVDKISEEIAAAQIDSRLRATTQNLADQGNEKAAEAFTYLAGAAKSVFSPKIAQGLNDWLANASPTTEEGRALLYLTKGRISEYRQAVIDGKMSTADFMRAVSKQISATEQENRTALMYNDTWRESLGLTIETVKNARNIANAASDKELDDQMEAAKKLKIINGEGKEGLKDLQYSQFKADQTVGIEADKIKSLVSKPFNNAFRLFYDGVRSVSILMLKVANWIGVGDGPKLQEAIELLSDESGFKSYIKDYKEKISIVDEQIKLQEKDTELTKKAAEEYKQAYQKQQELLRRKAKGEQVEQKEIDASAATAQQKYKEFQAQEKAEREKYKSKKTGIELEQERKVLQQNLQDRESREKFREDSSKDEPRTDTLSYTKYINADLAHFGQMKPGFQEKIGGLAEKYYALTGKKLNITSSYRTEAEQLELYNAWRDAGGRYPHESNPNPTVMTRFGLVSIPNKYPGQHGAGIAVDIDRNQLDFLDDRGILDQFGLKRHRPIEQDPVHVAPKAKFGGIFDGPEAGYPIEMHGTEAKIPLKNGVIGIELKNSGVPNDFLKMMSDSKPSIPTPSVKPAKTDKSGEFVNVLLQKIEVLDRKVSESNSIFSDIKLYMRN